MNESENTTNSSNPAPILLGYDFNGVIDTGRFTPNPEDVIITGNTYPPPVLDYLQTHNIKCRVYFQPDLRVNSNRTAAAVWKAEMITRIGVSKFYEDDTLQAQIIRAACPDCVVEQVG